LGLLPNVIFAQNSFFGQTGQKNFSAYLLGKHQNLFCPLCLKHQILHQKAHSATVPACKKRTGNQTDNSLAAKPLPAIF